MQMIINGQFVDSSSGKTFNNINPYNGQVVCTVPDGTREDFERAAEIAKKAQPAWAKNAFYSTSRHFEKVYCFGS